MSKNSTTSEPGNDSSRQGGHRSNDHVGTKQVSQARSRQAGHGRDDQARQPGSNRARRRQEMQKAARRRKIGWTSAVTAIVVIAGIVLGLHFANSPTPSSAASKSGANSVGAVPAVGYPAPNGTFTSLAGQQESVTSFQGKPTLLWFVSTWCSSCQAGTRTMAQNLSKLSADGVHVVEIELYKDLGQSGPSMQQFAQSLAGSNFTNPDWTFGVSSFALTHSYDPKGYLDIYYLLNAKGDVYYVNSTPSSTMPQLLQTAGRLA